MFMTRHSKQRTYGVEIRAYGANIEVDGILCAHCGAYEEESADPRRGSIAKCTCCNDFICNECVGKGCMRLEERLDAWERFNNGGKYLRRERLFEIFRASGGK